MDCPFKKWGYGHFYGPSYCEKANKKVTSYRYNQYCKSSCYSECPIYKENLEQNCFMRALFTKINVNTLDSKEILKKWNLFRKNILEKDNKYRDLLVYSDRISYLIADAIRNTTIESIDEFLKVIYENYIIIISNYINSNEVEKAVTRYQKMLELLIVNFSLNKEYSNMQYRYKHPELYKPKSLFRHIKGGE